MHRLTHWSIREKYMNAQYIQRITRHLFNKLQHKHKITSHIHSRMNYERTANNNDFITLVTLYSLQPGQCSGSRNWSSHAPTQNLVTTWKKGDIPKAWERKVRKKYWKERFKYLLAPLVATCNIVLPGLHSFHSHFWVQYDGTRRQTLETSIVESEGYDEKAEKR